jgi:LPXTG-site transpeptidase (sortase) family protein
MVRHRRRPRWKLLPVRAVVVGCAVAVAVPLAWTLSASSSTPTDLDAGAALSLAAQSPAAISRSSATAAPSTDSAASSPIAAVMPTTQDSSPMAVMTATPTPSPSASGKASSNPSAPRTTTKPTSAATKTAATKTALPTAKSASASPPVRIEVDALGLDAPVVPIGVDTSGDLAIPEDVQTAGWYRFGPAPGSAQGSVVIAGHVDSAQQGIGAFKALWSAKPGMTVTLDLSRGAPLQYRIVARETFDKTNTPLSALFSTKGAARLTLITCGGDFDEQKLSYRDNVVITAVPV